MSQSEDARSRELKEIQERIKNGQSIRSCAKLYGKRESTLRGQLKGAQTPQKGQELRQLLSPVQENDLIHFIRHEEACGRAISKPELRDLANEIVNPNSQVNRVGRNWPDRFLRRHPGVKKKVSTHLEAARSNETTPELLRRFYAELSSIVKTKGIKPSRMYNMDQQGLHEGMTKAGLVIVDALTKRATVTESDNRTWVSILESGNAEGRRLRPTVVFTGDFLQEQWFPELFPDWGYDVSETGFANQAVCLKWLRETFLPSTKPENPDDWRLLILDGFTGHMSVQFRFMALFHRVQILYLPPHSSHITQPFDVGVFGPAKAYFQRLAKKYAAFNTKGPIHKQRFITIYKEATDIAITPRNIRAGFKSAGIWPISLEKALSKVMTPSEPPMQNHGSSTPQHQRVSSPVIPYTPKTGNELIAQLKELQSAQNQHKRDLRRLGRKTARELDHLKSQNTIERQKSTYLQMEIDSQKPQTRQRLVWQPQACYPKPEEIRGARERKIEREERKAKRKAKKRESRKKDDTIVIPDSRTS
ncbi:hypothetical protein BFJ66_g18057 [Fusarium oxysporum f. sp. cepae]|uniref:HTH CENPB-type domain-containing protein n=1 Tax=Fusarium oxysporum f. sp. cepae TaxID=396571 RepID=A0A3L6N0N8_FUSOX|nr:hypothetical protein BFJ65_g14891 [Fusarium oxysporum f. sp. cepae]RKK15472.1 hypothetical protein BFJ67_g17935 [Fusarium oxysporum f. sp. cepae]RKK15603.1 hypothetical protein BFJ66_g18057 [Fusarium oxysporum f. sp. cepae]